MRFRQNSAGGNDVTSLLLDNFWASAKSHVATAIKTNNTHKRRNNCDREPRETVVRPAHIDAHKPMRDNKTETGRSRETRGNCPTARSGVCKSSCRWPYSCSSSPSCEQAHCSAANSAAAPLEGVHVRELVGHILRPNAPPTVKAPVASEPAVLRRL